jgi:hypothetical protein
MEKFNSENSSRTYRRELNALHPYTYRLNGLYVKQQQQQMLDNLLVANRAEKNMNSSHLECKQAEADL